MSWFEAYMLWSLRSVSTILVLVAVVLLLVYLFTFVFPFIGFLDDTHRSEREPEDGKFHSSWLKRKRGTAKCGIIIGSTAMFLFSFAAMIPSTETLLKIIATKKGVDAMQSETAGKYLSEVDKAVTNGFKILNQEIEKKLDKKVGK